ncbi:extradiol dioxygenase [Pyrococcus horikoshii]|uniref:Extradiol ring-cleavage dioxygenase class III enzyme subunit B domain-containing protein n=2 Tax=Pyrococcus horikoshii TaxID=53953 RepID=O58502_PYRHO|nr:extradiol dioxygenase [Pyrococcus horikoshii]BAA29848.1 262aa long hypothetical protein [Pyrococcus horikoshii OT3]HII61405.1 extradiol dioxygenase [Pyrococcus horikoshii]
MLVGMAVMPHGNEAVYPPDDESRKLNEALKEIGRRLKDSETYVLISPHNVRISDKLGIIMTEYLIPWLPFNDVHVPSESEYKTDRMLAEKIFKEARGRFPIVDINFASAKGRYSRFPLTWGEIIPLHFLEKREIVLLTPARIDRNILVEFGRFLGKLLEEEEKKIGLIISADHGHAHDEKGPYGYAKESEEYDKIITEALKSSNLETLLSLDDEFIAKAKPDSYWSLLIGLGVLKEIPMKSSLVTYACPTYYGMASALFSRK